MFFRFPLPEIVTARLVEDGRPAVQPGGDAGLQLIDDIQKRNFLVRLSESSVGPLFSRRVYAVLKKTGG
jgi:hypothetical protein